MAQLEMDTRVEEAYTNMKSDKIQQFKRNSFAPKKKNQQDPLVTLSEPIQNKKFEKPKIFTPMTCKEKLDKFIHEKHDKKPKFVSGAWNSKNKFMDSNNSFVTTKVKQKLNDCNEQLQPRLTQQSKLNQKQSQLQAKFAAIKTHIISKLKEPSKKLEAVCEGVLIRILFKGNKPERQTQWILINQKQAEFEKQTKQKPRKLAKQIQPESDLKSRKILQ